MALQTAFCSSAEVIYPTFFFKTKNFKKEREKIPLSSKLELAVEFSFVGILMEL